VSTLEVFGIDGGTRDAKGNGMGCGKPCVICVVCVSCCSKARRAASKGGEDAGTPMFGVVWLKKLVLAHLKSIGCW
jgi:hypothetical protein